MSDAKIYVGNLPYETRARDLDDHFYRYGKILDIYIAKGGFGFVEFADALDAQDAVKHEDGRNFKGRRIKVEISKRPSNRERGPRDNRGPRDGPGGRNGGGAPDKSEWRVLLTGLPRGCSWQDLKDFFRPAANVTFTKTFPDGTGAAEFATMRDMDVAINQLNDTEFRGSRISMKPDPDAQKNVRENGSGRGRSRSPGRGRDRRSRSRSAGRRYGRSPSPENGRGRDRSSSRDRGRDRSDSRDRRRDRSDSRDRKREYDDSRDHRRGRNDSRDSRRDDARDRSPSMGGRRDRSDSRENRRQDDGPNDDRRRGRTSSHDDKHVDIAPGSENEKSA